MSKQRFMDELEVTVEAGRGGEGSAHFARFKYQPKAGPDGGDGGKGGDVILVGDSSFEGLEHLAGKQVWKGDNGEHGSGAKKQGSGAKALELPVPLGTIVHDRETRFRLSELTQHGAQHIAARGGRGGRGNIHFATPKNRTPRRAEAGEPGEKREIALTYRVFAKAALMEDPSAGLQLLQGLMGKRTSSPHRFHQRPRRVLCELGFHKFDVAFLPLTTREAPRFHFVEHLHFAVRLLVNTLWMDSAEEAYPQLMRELSKTPAANLASIWMLCREDVGLPYQVEMQGRIISVRLAVPPPEVVDAESLWAWAQGGLQEFFLPTDKQG